MYDQDSPGMNLSLSKIPSGLPRSFASIHPNLPALSPLVTVCPSLSSFDHVIVSPTYIESSGGAYQTSAGVFNSGLNAPKGILIVNSSAWESLLLPKIIKNATKGKKRTCIGNAP